ncbi:MAG: ABC transporter permease subunit, partial [Anaerolineales bacterium]
SRIGGGSRRIAHPIAAQDRHSAAQRLEVIAASTRRAAVDPEAGMSAHQLVPIGEVTFHVPDFFRCFSLTLPAVTIGFYLAPVLLRSLRASLVETLSAEFVEAARARGLGERRVIFKHVLRNSMIAMVTILGVNVGFLISGAVVIENVFAIPGLGSLMVSSLRPGLHKNPLAR